MADLKELTARELLGRVLLVAEGYATFRTEDLAEIQRRLKRLEKCEAALREIKCLGLEGVEPIHANTRLASGIARAALKPQGGEEKR